MSISPKSRSSTPSPEMAPSESAPPIKDLVNNLLEPWQIDDTPISLNDIIEKLNVLSANYPSKLAKVYNRLLGSANSQFSSLDEDNQIEQLAQKIDQLISDYFEATWRIRPFHSAFVDEIMGEPADVRDASGCSIPPVKDEFLFGQLALLESESDDEATSPEEDAPLSEVPNSQVASAKNELTLDERIARLLNLLEKNAPPQNFDTCLLEGEYEISREQFISIWEEADSAYAIALNLGQLNMVPRDFRFIRFDEVVGEARERFEKRTADSYGSHSTAAQPSDNPPFPSGIFDGYFTEIGPSMLSRQEQISYLVSEGFDRDFLEKMPLNILGDAYQAIAANELSKKPVEPDYKGTPDERSRDELRENVEIIHGLLEEDVLDPGFVTDDLFGKTGITKGIFLEIWETARKIKGSGDERTLYKIRFALLSEELESASRRLRAKKERRPRDAAD